MQYNTLSKVEEYFGSLHKDYRLSSQYHRIPLIVVDNYVELGQLSALRFLEWVSLNPGGVIALPTGKTPEFFIKWVQFYLANWKTALNSGILAKIGLNKHLKPDMKSLYFFQLDEFFPIKPEHERSFTYFVKNFYVDGFGLDSKKVHLINTYDIPEKAGREYGKIQHLDEVFPDGIIDLGLRIQKPNNERDILKQKTIKLFDQFCQDFEDDIQQKGGIGYFMGGIGPDGHIAFNIKGSAHHSHTRLTNINYETQAAAASDLGGIEIVRKKAVITIGLHTITQNPGYGGHCGCSRPVEIRTGEKCRGIRSVHHFSCHRFAKAQACAVFYYTKCCHIANEERARHQKVVQREEASCCLYGEDDSRRRHQG